MKCSFFCKKNCHVSRRSFGLFVVFSMILQSVGIPGFTAIVLASESNEQSVEVEMIEGGKSDASWEENEKIDKEGSLDENQRKDKNLLEETFSDSIFDERIENNKQGGCVVKMKL